MMIEDGAQKNHIGAIKKIINDSGDEKRLFQQNKLHQLTMMIEDEIKKNHIKAINKIMKTNKLDLGDAKKYKNNIMKDINIKYKHLSQLDRSIKLLIKLK
jgi:hypothetical protein